MIRQLDVPIYDTNVLFLLDVTGEEFAEFLDNEQNKSRITEEEIKSIFDDILMPKFMLQQWRLNKLITLQDKMLRGVVKDWRKDREQSRTYRRMSRQEALRRYAQTRRRKHIRL